VDFLELYKKEGLRAVIRHMWGEDTELQKQLAQGDAREVWASVRRVDVASSLALLLVSDLRLVIQAALQVAGRIVNYCDPLTRQALEVGVSRLYDTREKAPPEQAALLEEYTTAFRRRMAAALGLPELPRTHIHVPEVWDVEAMTAVHALLALIGKLRNGFPEGMVRAETESALRMVLTATKHKLMTVDLLPEAEALRLAHEVLAAEFRVHLPVELFAAPMQAFGAPLRYRPIERGRA
jgi:hypothetical protein